ncbi:MAG: lamin tail domain-containing protein [Chloroflexota bacterium]
MASVPSSGPRRHRRALAVLTLALALGTLVVVTLRNRTGLPHTPPPNSEVRTTSTVPVRPTSTKTTRPSPTETALLTDTPPPTALNGPRVVITSLDPIAEYVDIQNIGDTPQSLDGWLLVSERGNQTCMLAGILEAGERLRIWADGGYEVGLHCRFPRNIWNNSEPDAAVLYNDKGEVVSRLE